MVLDTKLDDLEQKDVSVVIPTLGGETLIKTIEKVNSGSIIPAEILVCIPEEEVFRVGNIAIGNVKVIKTKCHGQVAQG